MVGQWACMWPLIKEPRSPSGVEVTGSTGMARTSFIVLISFRQLNRVWVELGQEERTRGTGVEQRRIRQHRSCGCVAREKSGGEEGHASTPATVECDCDCKGVDHHKHTTVTPAKAETSRVYKQLDYQI